MLYEQERRTHEADEHEDITVTAEEGSAEDGDAPQPPEDYAGSLLESLPETPADIRTLAEERTDTEGAAAAESAGEEEDTDIYGVLVDDNETPLKIDNFEEDHSFEGYQYEEEEHSEEEYAEAVPEGTATTPDNTPAVAVDAPEDSENTETDDTEEEEDAETDGGEETPAFGMPFPFFLPASSSKGPAARIAARTRAAALDITPRYIRLCAAASGKNPAGKKRRKAEKIIFADYEQEDIGSWEDFIESAEKTAVSVKTVAKNKRVKGAFVNIALPMSAAVLRTVPLSNMTTEELETMIAENETFWQPAIGHDKDPEDYEIQYDIVSRDQTNDIMYMNVAAYNKERFAFFKKFAVDCGFTPVSAEIRETALLRAAARACGEDETVGLLQIGPEENHFLITYQGLAGAGEIVINDWDRVALMNGDDQVLMSLASRYTDEITQISGTFQAECGAPPPSRICVASYIPLSSDFVRIVTEAFPEASFFTLVREGEKTALLRATELFPGGEEESALYKKPLCADICAVSMAGRYPSDAREGGFTPEKLNFYPGKTAFAKAIKHRFIGLAAAVCVAALCAAAILGGTAVSEAERALLSSEIEEMKAASAGYAAVIEEAKDLKNFTDTLKAIPDLAETLPLNQNTLAKALREVDRTIPSGVWLEDFAFTYPDTVAMTGQAFYDREILEFMNRLTGGGVFSSVTLNMMEAKENKKSPGEEDSAQDSAEKKRERLIKSFRIEASLPAGGAQ